VNCTGDQFRDASNYPNVYSVSSDNSMQAAASSYVAAKSYHPTRVDTFAYDYAQGHSSWETIQAHLKSAGMNFQTPIQTFVPLDSTNYRPQVAAMSGKLSGDANGRILYLLTYGSGTITFLKEAQQFGILSKYEAVFSNGQYYLGAAALGKSAPKVINSYDYCDYNAYTNPENKKFVSAYHAKYKGYPSDWVEQGYTEVLTLAQAIEKAKSTDGKKVLAAMQSLKVTGTPIGSFDFDASKHEANINIVSCQTVGDAGQPDGLRMLKADFVPTSVTFK
jgi:branched-chain amino acid transport system substrate-binding protein